MLQIRKNVFETNSSSTHSITMCSKDDYDRWGNGEVYLNEGWWSKDNTSEYTDKKFVTRDEVNDILSHDKYYHGYYDDEGNGKDKKPEDLTDKELVEYDIYTFDKYYEHEYLEWFNASYTTDSGETVVAFGLFGYDY